MTPSTIFVVAFLEFGFYTLFQFFHAKHILLGEFSVYGISILRRAWEWEKQNKDDTFRREREKGWVGKSVGVDGAGFIPALFVNGKILSVGEECCYKFSSWGRRPRPFTCSTGWSGHSSAVTSSQLSWLGCGLIQSSPAILIGLRSSIGCSEAFSFWLCVEWKKPLQFLACH